MNQIVIIIIINNNNNNKLCTNFQHENEKEKSFAKKKIKISLLCLICRYNIYIYTYIVSSIQDLKWKLIKYIFPAIACDQKFKFFFPAFLFFYQYSRFHVGYFFVVVILSTRSKKNNTQKQQQLKEFKWFKVFFSFLVQNVSLVEFINGNIFLVVLW